MTPELAKSIFLQKANQPAQPMQPPMMQQPLSSPLEERIGKSLSRPRLGIEDLLKTIDDTAQSPFVSEEAEQRAAKTQGQKVLGPTLEDADPDKIVTMATDDPEKVDPSLKGIYGANPDIAKTLAGIVKLQEDSQSTKLLKKLVDEETTPTDARKEVAEFFNTGNCKNKVN